MSHHSKQFTLIGLAVLLLVGGSFYFLNGESLQGRFSGLSSKNIPAGTTNSTETSTTPLPNLVATNISQDSQGYLTFTFQNGSTVDAPTDAFSITLYQDGSSVKQSWTLSSLGSSIRQLVKAGSVVTLDSASPIVGTSKLPNATVCVDSNYQVKESDETDNCYRFDLSSGHGGLPSTANAPDPAKS